jgi:predicted enzyme related to lactoylglutathione lyase
LARVTGIGGFFFPARDPEALARWYTEHFKIDPVPGDYETQPWRQEAGETVFAPFSGEPGGPDPAESRWILNLRVDDLDGIVAALRGAGIAVEVDPETYPNGRFAKLADPEGNPLELWQPAVPRSSAES